MTVAELLKWANAQHPQARYILLDVLGISLTDAYTKTIPVSDSERASIEKAVQDLCKGKPLAYILGKTEFCGKDYIVTPDVLIPRPCTQILVEALIDYEGPKTVVDIGTGSGCIADTLQRLRPDWTIYAVDISAAALEVAHHNGVQALVQADFCEAIRDQSIDIIVSNPPYIEKGDTRVEAAVDTFEPHIALYLGDGLEAYRRILAQAMRILKPQGMVAFEHGQGQEAAIEDLMRQYPFSAITAISDNAGISRVLIAQK